MLQNLKVMLGIALDETDLDAKLRLLISTATQRLRNKLGGIEPPDSMDHIIMEVAIKRFNRIGSEGLSSHTVEGESQQFTDDDFNEFTDEIQAFLNSQKESTLGKVRFL